jgi:hypothetical protein
LPPERDQRIDRFVTPALTQGLARELVDAGADIFVAHGSPALHGIEIYCGKAILYGPGNGVTHEGPDGIRTDRLDSPALAAYEQALHEMRCLTGNPVATLAPALERRPISRWRSC